MKTSYEIIKTIIRTEKGSRFEAGGKYYFEADRGANKIQIKKAVEELYKVKVDRVHTVKMPPKPKRVRMQLGHTRAWKKAIVTLKEGQKIEVT